jgi:integrase
VGRIYRQSSIVRDANGKPLIDPRTGKAKHRLRSKYFWIDYYDANGKRHFESSQSEKKGIAEKLLRDRESKRDRGEPVGNQIGKITADEALQMVVNDYQMNGRTTIKDVKRQITKHLCFFSGRRLSNIASDDLTAYVVHRQQEHAGPATINHELATVRRAFRLAQRAGKVVTVPFIPHLQEPPPRQGFFEREAYEAIRDLLPALFQPLLTFYYWTGWRNREVVRLEIRQVHAQEGYIEGDATQTKNRQPKKFHYSEIPELKEAITGQLASAEKIAKANTRIVMRLFHHPDGEPILDSQWRSAWVKARTAAGYPGALVHNCRRTAVRNMDNSGVSRPVAMTMVGMKTEAIYNRYRIVDEADQKRAAALYGGAQPEPAQATGRPKPKARVRQFRRS